MRMVHAGFDSLYVAFDVVLDRNLLNILSTGHEAARESGEPTHITLGTVEFEMLGHGAQGGYTYAATDGPLGAVWLFRDSKNTDWSIMVHVRSARLLCHPYEGVRDWLFKQLAEMGFRVKDHSINRVDYAMDFLAPLFEPHPEQVVAPSNTKVMCNPENGQPHELTPGNYVFRGRRLETLTIGSRSNRQVTLYDKSREARVKHKPHWFEHWGIPDEPDTRVWRLEIRIGKEHLARKGWNIRRFSDLENSITDVLLKTLEDIRYVADGQSDSNITRQTNHPIWTAAIDHLRTDLFRFCSGILPHQYLDCERREKVAQYIEMMDGLCVNIGVLEGKGLEALIDEHPFDTGQEIANRWGQSPEKLEKRYAKAQQNLQRILFNKTESSRTENTTNEF